MPVYVFVHSHDCKYKDEVVYVHPEIRGTVYYLTVPRCIETYMELEQVSRSS